MFILIFEETQQISMIQPIRGKKLQGQAAVLEPSPHLQDSI